MDCLVENSRLVIDRPKGSTHFRCNNLIYPLDYVFYKEIASGDGGKVEVWIGSLREKKIYELV